MVPPEPKLTTTVLVVGAGKALVVALDLTPRRSHALSIWTHNADYS